MTSATALTRTQIYLHPQQQSALAAMAASMHSSSSALIRQAIDAFLLERKPDNIKARRMATAGAWAPNPDFDLRALRREERQF